MQGDNDIEEAQEIVTAEVTDHFRQFMQDESEVQARQAAELRWRRFYEQLRDHDSHFLEMKKHYEARPIRVAFKRVSRGNTGDQKDLSKDLGKDGRLRVRENSDATSADSETVAGQDATYTMGVNEKSSEAGELNDVASTYDMPSTSSLQLADSRNSRIPPHRRAGSRYLSFVEVENAVFFASAGTERASKFNTFEEEDVRPMHRARASSSRAKSFVVVEEGRTLIDMIKARKNERSSLGPQASVIATTEATNEASEESTS